MTESRDVIERAIRGFEPRPYPLETFHRRRHRKHVRQRLSAAIVAVTVAVAGLAFLVAPINQPHFPPAGAPKNGAVVFLGPSGLYTIQADGSGYSLIQRNIEPPVPCPTGEGRYCEYDAPVWSPDGSQLAFIYGVVPGGTIRGRQGLFVMDADGTDLRKIADCRGPSGQGSCDSPPSWSPGGNQIAISSRGALVVVDLSDGQSTTIAGCNACAHRGFADAPSWSPEGTSIAFSDGRSVLIVRPDGSDPVPVTRARNAFEIAWSPDGQMLAFSSDDDPAVVRIDGTGRRTLALAGHRVVNVAHPVWSPDGRLLAYAHTTYGKDAEIRLVDIDHGTTSVVYHRACCVEQIEGPVWSPDGMSLAFSEREIDDPSLGNSLLTMRSDGSDIQRFPGWGTPTWQGIG